MSASIPEASSTMDSERPATRRRVLGLGWPVIGENLPETLLGIVDTLLAVGLAAVAIAGGGAGLQVKFYALALITVAE